MGLKDNHALYLTLRASVRGYVVAAQLDTQVHWPHQPKEKLSKIFRVARKKHPYLRRFAHDWATEEFAKAYSKRHRAHTNSTRRRLGGQAQDDFNQEMDGDEENGDEDEP
ncbi:hypothetical protein B0H21DRAFT_838944 [Amylocystis lapponica]|nr:hypothetical protein B0H21DRAFT_838944 [Amylocystis lapponica]